MRASTKMFLCVTTIAIALGCSSSENAGVPSDDVAEAPEHLLSNDQLTGSALPYRTISLTYDDGPDAYTLDIATYLHQQGIRATFFVNGCRFQGQDPGACGAQTQYPTSVLDQLVALGHRVANHTQHHFALVTDVVTAAERQKELLDTQALLDPAIHDGFYLFRAPSNQWSHEVGSDLRMSNALNKLVGPFLYDDAAGDWWCKRPDHAPLNANDCANLYIGNQAQPLQNGIFQLHDRNPYAVGESFSYEMTVALVGKLRNAPGQRYIFVPLDAIPGVRGQQSFSPPTVWTGQFSDGGVWPSNVGYYGTLRIGDVNGDGRADACGRDPAGVVCVVSRADGTLKPPARWSSALSDAQGWLPPEYSTTMELSDVDNDGRNDLCARGVDGLYCFKSNGVDTFSSAVTWAAPAFSNANGWNLQKSRYASIHLADVDGDGDKDACGRGPLGIVCARFNGANFGSTENWLTTEFRDDMGWSPAKYGATVQLADVNGDGKADVCGRGVWGLVCGISSGSSFGAPIPWSWPSYSDNDGWDASPSLYGSIRLADLDNDGKADVCGRNVTGVACAYSNGSAFDRYSYVYNEDFSDATGWGPEKYGTTLRLADFNHDGKVDICARGVYGLSCAAAP